MKYLTPSFLLILLASAHGLSAADPITWNLWPGEAPGEIVTLPPESDRTTDDDGRLVAGKRVTRLQNVSVPTLTIYKPDPKIDTGASVIIAPGGGFTILAFDLEGTEVAEWATSIGLDLPHRQDCLSDFTRLTWTGGPHVAISARDSKCTTSL